MKNIYKKVIWYRPKINKEILIKLHEKNDIYAFTYVCLHLSILLFFLLIATYFFKINNFVIFILTLLIYGMIYSFLGYAGASHELHHRSVFKKKIMNDLFFYLFSFLLWNNPIIFKLSHIVHHGCSIHEDCDGEIDHKVKFNKKTIINGVFNFSALKSKIKFHFLNSVGKVMGDWPNTLAKTSTGENNQKFLNQITNWSRFLILGHIILSIFFIFINEPILILIVSFGSFFGNLPVLILAMGQHNLMPTNKSDFRENTRTVLINPIIEFFYWHMNYHIEHSMFPKVPFYNLKKLRSVILTDLPEPTDGMINLVKRIS